MAHERERGRLIGAWAIVLASLALGGTLLCRRGTQYMPEGSVAFQREVWIAHSANDDPRNPRGKMVDDLIDRHLQNGMSCTQVLVLLGPPAEPPNGLIPTDPCIGRRELSWFIGNWNGFGIDDNYLVVKFDERGVLVSARWIQG